ncbi:MAG: hypothetical protein U0235_34630 [Polyangiaceae bacterium]
MQSPASPPAVVHAVFVLEQPPGASAASEVIGRRSEASALPSPAALPTASAASAAAASLVTSCHRWSR